LKKYKTIILAVFALLVCHQAASQSDSHSEVLTVETENVSAGKFSAETFQVILQQLQITSDTCYLPCVVETKQACGSLSIWVVPLITSMTIIGEPYSFSLACYVLLTDVKGKIVSKYYNPRAWASSELRRLTEISIDDKTCKSYINYTGAYSIIAYYEDNHSDSPAFLADVSLFIQQGESLQKVFDYTTDVYLEVYEYVYPHYQYYIMDKNLFLSGKKTNGFNDMVMTTGSIEGSDTDFTFFRHTGASYEETLKLDSVVSISGSISRPADNQSFDIFFYYGKTLPQAYKIWWIENMGSESWLKPELPQENIQYSIPDAGCCIDTDLEIEYAFANRNAYISIHNGHSTTTVEIVEKEEYILIKSVTGD
jgi:hypothetical protein